MMLPKNPPKTQKDKDSSGMSREEYSLKTHKVILSPCNTGVPCGPAGESSKKNHTNSQKSRKERPKELGSSD